MLFIASTDRSGQEKLGLGADYEEGAESQDDAREDAYWDSILVQMMM